MTNTENLLPCPFCGGEAEMSINDDYTGSVFIACKICGISTDTYHPSDKSDAIAAWNRREPVISNMETTTLNIVRCGECKHKMPREDFFDFCEVWMKNFCESALYEDDFCSYGIRREATNDN